jgi:hypothetical protein
VHEALKIAVAQPPCVSYDVAANAETHAATIRAADARVVVFPEFSLTGYELDAPAIAAADSRLTPIVEACAEVGSLALVGAAGQGREGEAHIAMLAVDGTGVTLAYRKMWLGTAESQRFTPGSKPAVLEVDGWRLGLAICKDTGIPRHVEHLDPPRRRDRPSRTRARRHRPRHAQLTTTAHETIRRGGRGQVRWRGGARRRSGSAGRRRAGRRWRRRRHGPTGARGRCARPRTSWPGAA